MSFEEIAYIDGAALERLLDEAKNMVENDMRITHVRAVVDDGSLKLKINEGVWSAPIGRPEVTR